MALLTFLLIGSMMAHGSTVDPSKNEQGALCIAPFHRAAAEPGRLPPDVGEPIMSQTTWPPSAGSHFKFLVDGKLRATVGNDESSLITGLPTDRPIRIKVILDGKPFESFRLSLGKEPDHRVCLRLYPGYWHWLSAPGRWPC